MSTSDAQQTDKATDPQSSSGFTAPTLQTTVMDGLAPPKCQWCGAYPHSARFACPAIEEVEFGLHGEVRRVKLRRYWTQPATAEIDYERLGKVIAYSVYQGVHGQT